MEGEPPPVEERRRLQQELSEFVESCCRRLEEVTASLGWSLDRLDPGEEAAEVRGACVPGPFGGPQRAVSCWEEESAWEPPPVCRAVVGARDRAWSALDACGPRVGRVGAFRALCAGRPCGAPAEFRFKKRVKMRWVRRDGRSRVYLENTGIGLRVPLAEALPVCFVMCHMDGAVAPDLVSGELGSSLPPFLP